MKRGFLNKPNAFGKTSTPRTDNGSNIIQQSLKPHLFNYAEQSRMPGGLKRGKVDVGDFKAPELEIQIQAIDNTKLDYADDEWFASTQPAQSPGTTLEDVPDNWSVCYISGRAKRAILSVPGFPEALPRPDSSRPKQYKIIETPGKGMGMFATCDIEWGELILTERPLLVFPASNRHMSSLAYPKDFTIDQIQQAQLNQLEKVMETLVNQMPKENQEAYKRLANCHQEDGSGPLHGIARTNGFSIGDYYEPKIPGFPEAATRYSGTFKDISRINHSCRPNTRRDWDSPTFSLHLRATKPIKKGQEITLSYISDGVDPTTGRQRQLASYGFTCTCEACSNPEISDPRSKQIKELLKPVATMINPMTLELLDPATAKGLGMGQALLESGSSLGMAMTSPLGMPGTTMSKGLGAEDDLDADTVFNLSKQMGQNAVEPALKGLKLLEEEGLTGTIWYWNLLGRVSEGYNMMALNDQEMDREAIKWHQKSERYKKLFKSARNAKWREEKEREEEREKGEEKWNDDEEYKKLVDEMTKKMFATRPRPGA
ncbi:SET domain-containing protein [Dendrothele bispora CBS 962.96]|uniref:SET domain-containing protein n=1 Tax=Dendrothele bispora (strain CBS 962.96) TaxID=1314807 RepID=A0A4S8LBZ3_DENBC|nr:SET domain-containing protein [Dendrothele bispora CBS 962.96]